MEEEQELYRIIVERLPEAIVIHDGEKILYANPTALKFIGEKGLSLRIPEFIHPNFRPIAMERIKTVLSEGKVEPYDELFILPNGRKVWVETNPSLITFRGKPAVLLILRDRTEKIKAEKKYKEFFDNSLDIIVVTDIKGNFLEVNRAFEETFGLKSEEVKGKHFAEVLGIEKEVAEEIFRSYNRAFREKRDLKGLVFEVKRRDGGRIVVEGNVRLLWEGGKVVGFVGNFRDITDRIRLQEKLRESEEKYRKIFEHSPTPIALVNEISVFIEANPAMAKSIGKDPIGKSHYELFPKEVAERRGENIRKVIEKNEPIVFQDERDGRHFINYYIPIELEGRRLCLVISQEITELLRLNKLLREIIEVNKAMARARDRDELIKKVEEILSEYSAKIADLPQESCFSISHDGRNYGYLCVKYSGEEERVLLETLAKDIAFALKAIEDEKERERLLSRLIENVKTFAFLVDRIRNPLAVISGLAETLIEKEEVRGKILQQVERIVEIVEKLDVSWKETEKFIGSTELLSSEK